MKSTRYKEYHAYMFSRKLKDRRLSTNANFLGYKISASHHILKAMHMQSGNRTLPQSTCNKERQGWSEDANAYVGCHDSLEDITYVIGSCHKIYSWYFLRMGHVVVAKIELPWKRLIRVRITGYRWVRGVNESLGLVHLHIYVIHWKLKNMRITMDKRFQICDFYIQNNTSNIYQ